MQRMMECVDGDYQTFKSQSGAYVREHFFGKYPELLELVADLSDDEIWALHRGATIRKGVRRLPSGGAYPGRPTVVLAKTVKGFGMGKPVKGRTSTTS